MYVESIVAVRARLGDRDLGVPHARAAHDRPFWTGLLVREGLVLTAVTDTARQPDAQLYVGQSSPAAAHSLDWQPAELVWKQPWDNDPGRGTVSAYPNPAVRCALLRIGSRQPSPAVRELRISEVQLPPRDSAVRIAQAVDEDGGLRAQVTTEASLYSPNAVTMTIKVPVDHRWRAQDEIFGAPVFCADELIGVVIDQFWGGGERRQEARALSMQRFPF